MKNPAAADGIRYLTIFPLFPFRRERFYCSERRFGNNVFDTTGVFFRFGGLNAHFFERGGYNLVTLENTFRFRFALLGESNDSRRRNRNVSALFK